MHQSTHECYIFKHLWLYVLLYSIIDHQIVLEFYRDHGYIIAMLCTRLKNDFGK